MNRHYKNRVKSLLGIANKLKLLLRFWHEPKDNYKIGVRQVEDVVCMSRSQVCVILVTDTIMTSWYNH